MLSIRFVALIAFSVQLFLTGNLLALDKILRTSSSNVLEGKITKVDDSQVYVQDGPAQMAYKRSELQQVEIEKPAGYQEALKAYEEGKNEKAIATFEVIHNQYYGLPEPWLEDLSIKLGQAYLNVKMWGKAVDIYTKFKKFYPQSLSKDAAIAGEAHAAFGVNDKTKAITLLEGLISERGNQISVSPEQSEGLARACLILGRCYLGASKTEQALETFLKVPVLYHMSSEGKSPSAVVAEAQYEAALIYEKMNNPTRAKSQFEEIISQFPDSPFAAEAKKRMDSKT